MYVHMKTSHLKVHIFLIILASMSTSAEEISERIVGGDDAPPAKYPFYAFLRKLSDEENTRCGSVILSRTWVLSAAHCTFGIEKQVFWVVAGFLDSTLLSYQQRSKVLNKYEHPAYDDKYIKNDVVVLQLKTQFYFDAIIQPIALPDDRNDVVADWTKCDIIGFGRTGQDLSPQYEVLQQAQVVVLPFSQCRAQYGSYRISASTVCTLDPASQKGICKGDSGGPLACYDNERGLNVLRGVASFKKNTGCVGSTFPNVFSRVSHHVDWIRDTMEYSAWENGVCSVTCGQGTRRDRRKCLADACDHQLLNRVSICEMPKCSSGEDVCKDIFCSPNAECREKSGGFVAGSFECECLPEFRGDGKDCIFNNDVQFNDPNGASYSKWTFGACKGICNFGRRRDTRQCLSGNCTDELVRTVDCKLTIACEGDMACSYRLIHCDKNAICVQHSGGKSPECECKPGFEGDGKTCRKSATSGINSNQLLVVIATLIKFLFV